LCNNCLLKQAIEGKIEEIGIRGRRLKQLLDKVEEDRRYWNLKEEALSHTVWRTGFGRSYGSVARQTTEWITRTKIY
jgi:hypothetical protein